MSKNKLSVCRCCLAEKRSMKDMADVMQVAEKQETTILCCYFTCSGIDLSQTQPESNNICKPCERKLINAYEFRELCQESNRVLLERSGLLSEVKKEDISDEEVKPDLSQVFNQVFLEDHPEVAPIVSAEVIKIEDDDQEPEEPELKPDAKVEVPEDDEASKSPGPDDNWNDGYESEEEPATNSKGEPKHEQQEEEKTTEDNDVDDFPGKFLCFQCDLVLDTLGEYTIHRIACKGSRYRQHCNICNEAV
jgi:Zinc-finger associated domain (zf-AD)